MKQAKRECKHKNTHLVVIHVCVTCETVDVVCTDCSKILDTITDC